MTASVHPVWNGSPERPKAPRGRTIVVRPAHTTAHAIPAEVTAVAPELGERGTFNLTSRRRQNFNS